MRILIKGFVSPDYFLFNIVKVIVLLVMIVGFFGTFILPLREMEVSIGFGLVSVFLGLICYMYLKNLSWGIFGSEELVFSSDSFIICHSIGKRKVFQQELKIGDMKSISYCDDIKYKWYQYSFPTRSIGRFKITTIYEVDYFFGQNIDNKSPNYERLVECFTRNGIPLLVNSKIQVN